MPNPRAAFQDKVVGGGVQRDCPGGGAGKRAIRTAVVWGGNQPGHGGGPRSPAPRSRWRPRASGSPRLLGLCSASNGSESAGGSFQSPLAGTGAGDHLATCCHHVRLRLSLPLPVSALSGTPLHLASAGPRLHSPVGHWIPTARAVACPCPGYLPPPLPAPPPGRLPRALQPSPLQAPAHPTAEANPSLTRFSVCSHTGKGLGLRCLESRILSIALLVSQGLETSPGVYCPSRFLTAA